MAFPLLKNTDFNLFFLKNIATVSKSCNFEVCGAVTQDKIYFFENLSPTPKENFVVHPQKYSKIYSKIVFFFHSHCLGASKPSDLDIELSNELARPFLIYSTVDKNFSFYSPKDKKLIYFSL